MSPLRATTCAVLWWELPRGQWGVPNIMIINLVVAVPSVVIVEKL